MRVRFIFFAILAFLPLGAFAQTRVLARCEATKMVCALVSEGESRRIFLYPEGKPGERVEVEELGELIVMNVATATAVFTKDGKYLVMEGGTGSAGRDFTIYQQVEGLTFKMIKDEAVSQPVEALAFKLGDDGRVLDHSRVEFVGWVGPHLMRVKLSGRGETEKQSISVDGWVAHFDLKTLKALPVPKATNAGKIKRRATGK